jgi:hypothetical protein
MIGNRGQPPAHRDKTAMNGAQILLAKVTLKAGVPTIVK